MKLTELEPGWLSNGGEGVSNADGSPVPRRERIGICFNCPCGTHVEPEYNRVAITFSNPIDGGPPVGGNVHWERDGDDFETLTIRPSIQRVGGCAWHGFVTNGEVTGA